MGTAQKAVVTKVPFGEFEIEGLMLPNGEFAIGVPQVAALILAENERDNGGFRATKRTFSKILKRICGADFGATKKSVEGSNQEILVMTIRDFEFALAKLDRAGFVKAQVLRDALIGLSLTQLWSDAFGIKFEQEERQKFLKQRLIHQKHYHDRFTPWTKKDLIDLGVNDKKEAGIIYGSRMNQFKLKLALPLEFIGTYNSDQLQRLNDAELIYHTLRDLGKTHEEAQEMATQPT